MNKSKLLFPEIAMEDLSEAVKEIIPGNVIAIASRPAIGKTYTALKLINTLSGGGCVKTLYFTSHNEFTQIQLMVNSIGLSSNIETRLVSNFSEELIEKQVKEGVSLIVIDELRNLEIYTKQETIKILKSMAQKYNIPIIVITDVKRSVEHIKNHRPTLKDICSAKTAVKLFDSILLLYREHFYNHDEINNNIEINIAKKTNSEASGDTTGWF